MERIDYFSQNLYINKSYKYTRINLKLYIESDFSYNTSIFLKIRDIKPGPADWSISSSCNPTFLHTLKWQNVTVISQLDGAGQRREESVLGRSSSWPWFIIFLLLSQPPTGSQANCYRAVQGAVLWREAGRSRDSSIATFPHCEQQAATKICIWWKVNNNFYTIYGVAFLCSSPWIYFYSFYFFL